MFTLSDFIDDPVWLAWRNESRHGKPTKVPYSGKGGYAKSNDPATWTPLDVAVAKAEQIGGGPGIALGIKCDQRYQLGGVDLDTCRDPNTGQIEPWAQTVINRLGTYGEVSPSQTGVKLFFAYRADQLDALRGILNDQDGKAFKQHSAGDHPPGIEVYVAGRYFAVTTDAIGDAEINPISVADLQWLVVHAESCFPRKAGEASATAELERSSSASGHDQSRSAKALHYGESILESGITDFPTFKQMMLASPHREVVAWVREKGLVNSERELRRIFHRARPHRRMAEAMAEMRAVFEAEARAKEAEENPPVTVTENVVLDRHGLSLGATALYVYFARLAGNTVCCRVTITALVERFGCSRGTCDKYIAELVKARLIERQRAGKSNLYRLL